MRGVFLWLAIVLVMGALLPGQIAQAQEATSLESLQQQVDEALLAGHNGWMLTCCALVLFMTAPGLALFYGGLVRRNNVLS